MVFTTHCTVLISLLRVLFTLLLIDCSGHCWERDGLGMENKNIADRTAC